MKKTSILLIFIVLLYILAQLSPSFLGEDYIIEKLYESGSFERAKLEAKGIDLKISLTPKIILHGAQYNDNSDGKNIAVKADKIEITLALIPMFFGKLKPSNYLISNPNIYLDFENGVNFSKVLELRKSDIARIVINNGDIYYKDDKRTKDIYNINMVIEPENPLNENFSAEFKGGINSISIKTNNVNGKLASLEIRKGEDILMLSNIDQTDERLKADVKATINTISEYSTYLLGKNHNLLGKSSIITAGLTITNDELLLEEGILESDILKASIVANLDKRGKNYRIGINIEELSLDKIIAENSAILEEPVYTGNQTSRTNFTNLLRDKLELDLHIAKLHYNKKAIEDIGISLILNDDTLLLNVRELTLPGGTKFNLDSNIHRNNVRTLFEGAGSVVTEDFGELLSWAFGIGENLPENLPAELEFSYLVSPKEFRIKKFKHIVGDSELHGQYRARHNSTLPTRNIYLSSYKLSPEILGELLETFSKVDSNNVKEKTHFNVELEKIVTLGNQVIELIDLVGHHEPFSTNIENIRGIGDFSDFNGSMIINRKALRPSITANFRGKALDVTGIAKLFGLEDILSLDYIPKAANDLSKYDGKIEASFGKVKLNDKRLSDLSLAIQMSDDFVQLSEFKFTGFRGGAGITGNYDHNTKLFSYSFSANNLNLAELDEKLYGYLSLSGSLNTVGTTFQNMLGNMNANIAFSGRNMKIEGMDLLKLRPIITKNYNGKDINENLRKITSEGSTLINEIDGLITTRSGLATLQDVVLKAGYITGGLAGSIDIINNYNSIIRSKIAFIPKAGESALALDLELKGPIADLEKSLDTTPLIKYLENQ